MRVLVDARKLGDGGIGDYLSGLILGLVECGVTVSLVVKNESQVPTDSFIDRVFVDSAKPYSLDELFNLPRRLPLNDFDLFHSPHYTLPYGIPIPSVVTIHDLIHVTHGQSWYYKFASFPNLASAALRANGIFCVSEFTRSELLRFLPRSLVQHKISITPNVISGSWIKDSVCPGPAPYFLAVLSTHKPHKGGHDLATAWGLIAHQLDSHRLVVVGEGSIAVDGEKVFSMGRVSSDEYSRIFRGADALVVPSLVEGFCVPALRAIYEGLPVVARPIPALKELLGDEATFADSMNVEDLSAAIFDAAQGGVRVQVEHSSVERERILERHSRSVVMAKVLLGYRDAIDRARQKR